jgi:hypothetical protein
MARRIYNSISSEVAVSLSNTLKTLFPRHPNIGNELFGGRNKTFKWSDNETQIIVCSKAANNPLIHTIAGEITGQERVFGKNLVQPTAEVKPVASKNKISCIICDKLLFPINLVGHYQGRHN